MIKNFICKSIIVFIIIIGVNNIAFAQNSLLVNFGTNSCSGSGAPAFSLIKNPFSDTASPLTTCSVAAQVPDIFSVFIAYNPKDNKLYLADIRTGSTKIWALDMGLPKNITCPPTLNTIPDNIYSYVSNNFEFDNNGDLWSFSNYNQTLGQCNMDKFDVNTGTVINTRVLQFPAGNFPTSITSGDLTILPNGRMFATLGSDSSKLYEIINYNSNTTNATAIYLKTLPQNCFGIAYLNGQLEITGTDFSGNCYYYKYSISNNILDSAVAFQDGQLPIDNTSITPSVGVTKQLINTRKINANTADVTYEIYVKNLGNVALNNINVSDNLARIYGVGNISDLQVAFTPGGNAAGLTLNTAFNGGTDSALLAPGQNLANQTLSNMNYFFKLRLSFRVTNLTGSTYNNSAIGTATIGTVGSLSFINVSDSSNNGPETAVDPNNNGNAGEVGENIPTPLNLATLPVKFISINASAINQTSAVVSWVVATPTIASDKFEIQYSSDTKNWISLGSVAISNVNQDKYGFSHLNVPPGDIYYRIKETDIDGAYVFSSIAFLRSKNDQDKFVVYPNPANNFISILGHANGVGQTKITLYDAVGKQVASSLSTGNVTELKTSLLKEGSYILKIENQGMAITRKVIIMHE